MNKGELEPPVFQSHEDFLAFISIFSFFSFLVLLFGMHEHIYDEHLPLMRKMGFFLNMYLLNLCWQFEEHGLMFQYTILLEKRIGPLLNVSAFFQINIIFSLQIDRKALKSYSLLDFVMQSFNYMIIFRYSSWTKLQ